MVIIQKIFGIKIMAKRFLTLILFFLLFVTPIYGQESQSVTYKGQIREVNTLECEEMSSGYVCYTYSVYIKDLDENVETMISTLEKSDTPFRIGDSVYLTTMEDLDGQSIWSITGYARGSMILAVSIVFIVLTLLIGGKKSIGSIISLIASFFIIYSFIIPQIINSGNIFLIGYIGVFLILIIGMYLSHGFNKSTTIALISTIIGVVIVSLVAWLLMEVVNINGMGDETAFLLSSQTNGEINIKSLFFISIIIGAVGVLDDVTVGQVSSMYEIYKTDKNLSAKDLYLKTMNVGREHVASMINTLFIVYAGSSLPFVSLMYLSNRNVETLISIDLISEEIVRTLAISICLVLLIPISTYISSVLIRKDNLTSP
jgi:uncharacterized membrane protein